MLTSRIADACAAGQARYEEKRQAEADKDTEEEPEMVAAAAELQPGERKVISDGTDGPVVEIIRRSTTDEEEPEIPENTDSNETEVADDSTSAEKAGE